MGALPRLPRTLRHQVPPLLHHPRSTTPRPITLARTRHPVPTRTGTPIDTRDLEARLLADDADTTTQVIGSWTYAGTGWRDDTEEALALATAARSREYDLWKAQRRTTRSGLERRT